MDFIELVRTRRMTRTFTTETVERSQIAELVELATMAPSAGKTQGWHVMALDGNEVDRFWSIAFPLGDREGFAWPGLFNAPVVTLWFADPWSYADRYSEDDKKHTGLGGNPDNWPTPYWTVDASMSMNTFYLV